MRRFELIPLPLRGLVLAQRQPLSDSRGFLERMFCAEVFRDIGVNKPIAQVNHTLTRHQGTVRGLHYQKPPHSELKIVSCLRGQVFDVAVDLRAGSPTFLQWHGEVLSQENGTMLVIPEGFAHGFQTLTDECEMLYFHTASYAAEAEGGISPLEPRLGIKWRLPIAELSKRDQSHPPLSSSYEGIVL